MLNHYFRNFNTNVHNSPFSEATKLMVWSEARVIPGYSHLSHEWRTDQCGAIIKYSDYGNTASINGWEIDHINPVSNGGTDALSNLQPLQWQNNRQKSDTIGTWYCKVGG